MKILSPVAQTPVRLARTLVLLAGAILASAALAHGHETDQVTLPPGREFADLGPYLSSFFYKAVEDGAAKVNARIRAAQAHGDEKAVRELQSPDDIALAVNREFPIALFFIESLDGLAKDRQLRLRNPGRVIGHKDVSTLRKYAEFQLSPFRAWGCATIRAYDTYFGTDKVGHFTDMGMHYFRAYRKALGDGLSEEQAVRAAIRLGTEGPISERGVLGFATAGAYSNADLVANYTGMLFYLNLTQPVMLHGAEQPPALHLDDNGRWAFSPHVRKADFFRPYISDHLNEAINPSLYLDHMRLGIRRATAEYADRVLERFTDARGNRQPASFFAEKARELRTYWGFDYGHRGAESAVVTVADACFPRSTSSPETRDEHGRTALHDAAEAGDVAEIARLLDAGADVNAEVRSKELRSSDWGCTPLHLAARHGHVSAIKALLAAGASVNRQDDRGRTALHEGALDANVLALLLDVGADPSATEIHGWTALHMAACFADAGGNTIATLLHAGLDPQARDAAGRTPLHLVVAREDDASAMVSTLIAAGADPGAGDALGVTSLHMAAAGGPEKLRALEVLLKSNAEKNVVALRDDLGRTPLHDAAKAGNERAVSLLLRGGASTEIADAYGNRPLHLAARAGHEEVAHLLVENGADLLARSSARRTPIEEARAFGRTAVLTVLQSDMAAKSPEATLASGTVDAEGDDTRRPD